MARGVLGFKIKNEYKVQYIDKNADFELLGADCVEFIQFTQQFDKKGLQDLKRRLSGVYLVNNKEDFPTEQNLKDYASFYTGNVNNKEKIDWYTLLAKLQSIDFFVQVKEGNVNHIVDGIDFGSEVGHCEYGYIFDFDENQWSVYYGLEEVKGDKPFDKTELGIRLIKSFPFEDIPSTWMEACDEKINV